MLSERIPAKPSAEKILRKWQFVSSSWKHRWVVLMYRTMDGEEDCGRWHYTALAHSSGRIFSGLWQNLIQNSLTSASRGFCSQLSALLPTPIRELCHSAQAFVPLTSP